MRLFCDDGSEGTGYSYTIGNGGSSLLALLRDHIAPRLLGKDAEHGRGDLEGPVLSHPRDFGRRHHQYRAVRRGHGAVGPALPRCRFAAACDGRRRATPHSGLRHRGRLAALEAGAKWSRTRWHAKAKGFRAVKIKIGTPARRGRCGAAAAVRKAVGAGYDIMTDANQCFTVSEAIRRARHYEAFDLAWFEEPLPAEDLNGHVLLSRSTSIPIAIGESLYSSQPLPRVPAARRLQHRPGRRRRASAASRRGSRSRTWPRRSTFKVCPHFLMEIHLGLCCAVPNATWLEHIPQLDDITQALASCIKDGYATPSFAPGLGIEWDWSAIERRRKATPDVVALSRASPKLAKPPKRVSAGRR